MSPALRGINYHHYMRHKIRNNFPGTSISVCYEMRYTYLSFLVMSFSVSLGRSLSLRPFNEASLFDFNSDNDDPIGLGEPATFVADADLKAQPGGEPLFPDSSGSSEDSDYLFGIENHSSFSTLPDDGSIINSNTLLALGPNPGSSDQTQADLLPSHADSGTNETPPELGDILDNYINEGLNYLLPIVSPFDKECDKKAVGKVPLCCNSPRKELPFAYGCKPYDPSNVDCQYYNYQFCCLGYNPIDSEGVTCTKGFYVD